MSSSSSNLHTSSAVILSLNGYVESIWIEKEEIESATNNFADENLMKQITSSEIYKGRLLQSSSSGEVINIVARVYMQLETKLNELNMLKDLRHQHIVPLFKYSETDDKKGVMIYKHEANESLDKHLSTSLSWMQRLNICVGIARALKYLHFDAEENHSVIHGNVKSSKILLDHNWEPKLHGFRFAVRAKKNQLYLTHKYNGSLLYKDPAYETTRGLTTKSDVFSFGVVMFEILFGMEAASVPVSTPDHNDNWYFARMARAHYEKKTLDEKINPSLRKQMSIESLNIFSEVAYYCLKERRPQRPDMKKVLQRLERALEHQRKHETPEHSENTSSNSNHPEVKNLDHLRIHLSDIRLATDNFSSTYCIGSGGYGRVYKAKLREKRGTVAIKRIFRREDAQAEQGFLAEIELLSKCNHPNIVSLIGFCNEEQEMILIYEFASNGSVEDYFGDSVKITDLTWAHRIQICIDIAYGLEYLHKVREDKECIIHRDIKSANILLDDKWGAKIADFGLSKLHPTYDQRSTFISDNIGGTEVYIDPEYLKTGNLKTQSDIYSFGVVMCEMISGTLANDIVYSTSGLPSLVRQCVKDGTIENLVDPQLKEVDEDIYVPKEEFNQDSLYAFSEIASQCVAEAQGNRPTIEVIIKELERSLNLQSKWIKSFQISLEAIKLGTQNFIDCNCIGEGRFWRLYDGEISPTNENGRIPIVVKRFDKLSDKGNSQFMRELKVLKQCKHNNIIGLVGYCNEMGERIIVYEHASNGTLDKHLDNANLTWMDRLKIGLDVARGLEYLHTGGITENTYMIHTDIKSSSIVLDGDWRAKLSNLEESTGALERKIIEHIDDDNAYGSLSYVDPDYKQWVGYLTDKSDMYSLGVVLLEMLLGRLAWAKEESEGHSESFVTLAKRWYKKDHTLDEKIFEGIKEQIVPRSLDAFSKITFQCLEKYYFSRPKVTELVEQLTLALAYQEDYEMWQPRLPKDYEKLYEMSDAFCLYNANIYRMSDCDQGYYQDIPGRIKDFYDALYNGYLFQEGKGWFSLGSNGKRNVMISATQISYTNRWQRKWRSFPKSRFQVVAQMLDILNLKIRIKIKPQVLLSGDSYRVHLVFKFSEPRKCLAKQRYVNLKYKRGNDNLQTDFATWREDGWMMIELGQILNYVEDTDFEVFLESFSRGYCGSTVYIQGIEFRTIDNEEYEEDGSKEIEKCEDIQKLKEDQQVLKSYSNMDKTPLSIAIGSLIGNHHCAVMERFFKRTPKHGLPESSQANQSSKKQQADPIEFSLQDLPSDPGLRKKLCTFAKAIYSIDAYEWVSHHKYGTKEGTMFSFKGFLLKQVQKENICFILSERKRSVPIYSVESSFASIPKPFHLKYSAESRFQGEIELLKQQVFGIKDKIESQMLSPDKDYMCYLVFKLLENCRGLHCPVKVRHGIKRENKEIGLICFRTPSPWNLPDSNGAPKERADGWMEVLVWKFNSNSDLKNDRIHINLKFITYEGTMSGLILRGLEIRPI